MIIEHRWPQRLRKEEAASKFVLEEYDNDLQQDVDGAEDCCLRAKRFHDVLVVHGEVPKREEPLQRDENNKDFVAFLLSGCNCGVYYLWNEERVKEGKAQAREIKHGAY